MKRQFKLYLLFLAFIVTFAFIACTSEIENYVVGEEALMTGLRIGNVKITDIPEPIDSIDYDDEEFDISDSSVPVSVAALERSSDTVNARFWPVVSKGARVLWGIGSQDMRPFTYKDLRVPANFEDADYIYFMVTSEDGEAINYYRFSAWVRSPVTGLVEAYIGKYEAHEEENDQGNMETVVDVDERMLATGPAGNDILVGNSVLATAVAASPNTISIKEAQSVNADIMIVRADATATLKYAMTTDGSAVPASFNDTFSFSKLNDQSFFYVQVTAQNQVDIAYYKFRIQVGRITTLTGLYLVGTLGDPDEELTIEGLGTTHTAWASVVPGSYRTADMPSGGFKLRYELLDDKAEVTYGLYTGNAEPTWAASGDLIFNGSNALGVKVKSHNGAVTRYYKVTMELLAAVFKEQPKPNYYYFYDASPSATSSLPSGMVGSRTWYEYVGLTVDSNHDNFTDKGESTVEPLEFELDRPGTFTYQWYEANSWYGGYGFDADGRMLYYDPGNPVAVMETGFTKDALHQDHFDEKKNVSLHNGGNQFYNLPNMGRKIPGATNATYTPKINYRPFIAGFTYEAHFYWVEVKETTSGRTATSKRVVIISERDPTKKHHIVDLNRDLNKKGDPWNELSSTEVGFARNQKPFTKQREKYSIPISFPKNFKDEPFAIEDYTVATVQALFWLKDGTQWIQNWTQGDIGFDNMENERVVYYYNLTNNNATLGLIGGGKEPNGASLKEVPGYLVVKPAGEKPVAQLPPFKGTDDYGRPTPENVNDAQGWFTAFIELVEVHFEGPAQPVE